MIRGDLSVRALAEFVCRCGDLYPVREERQVEPEEGLLRQQAAQRQRSTAFPGYAKEVAVEGAFVCGGVQRRVKGRMDGLLIEPHRVVIEEFKCRGALPDAPDAVDRAQAWIYAGLYARDLPDEMPIEVRVTYIDADTADERVFTEPAAPPTRSIRLHS